MQQGHREQLTASCWSPWAAGGSSLVLSALWGRVTGARTPFLLLGICEHETRATAVGILLKWWHEHGRGICCHFMGNSKLPPTAIVRPLVSESSMVHASFALVHLIGIKAYSWKVQQLFKFHRRILGFPELRKKTTKQTCQPVFILSNSKSNNVLESFILPLTILLHTAKKIIIIVVMLIFWGQRVCSNLLSKEGTNPSRNNWKLGPPSKLYTKYIWVFFQQWIWIWLQICIYGTFNCLHRRRPLYVTFITDKDVNEVLHSWGVKLPFKNKMQYCEQK